MTSRILQSYQTTKDDDQVSLYYVERILEQLELGCFKLAKQTFEVRKTKYYELLKPEHFSYLNERVHCEDDWSEEKEQQWVDRLRNAWSFGVTKIVHDMAHEILLHHDHKPEECSNHSICEEIVDILATNNSDYIEPDEVNINTFINPKVAFVVDQRRSKTNNQRILEGNPGFNLTDALGQRYRCFIKQISDVNIGDQLNLKITNIPGLMLTDNKRHEKIIYLEPRVIPGELIEVELSNISYTGNSFTFRYHSYDGFLWFKRKGVNKEVFNKNTLNANDRIIAKVIYTTEEEKRSKKGNISRLGIIKAIPVKRAGMESNQALNQDTGVARVLN